MKLMLVPETEAEREALEHGAVPGPVLEMALGMAASRAIMTAVELGILSALAQTPGTTEGLAGRLSLDPEGLHVLMQVLESFGLVAFGPRGWMPTARGAWLLRPDLADLVRFNQFQWELCSELEQRLVNGGEDLHVRDVPDVFWTRYLRALAITAGETCQEIAQRLPLQEPLRILDVGGGHGRHAASLCDRWPDAVAVVLDLKPATVAGDALNDHERVRFEAADLRDGAWGNAEYDAVLLFNLTPHLDADQCRAAFESAARALVPGGRVAVLQPRRLVNRGEDAQLDACGDLLYWLAAGRRPWPEVFLREALAGAGFVDVERIELRTAPKSLLLTGRISGT